MISFVSALKSLSLPTVTLKYEDGEVQYSETDLENSISINTENRKPLKLQSQPVSCTIAVFENKLLVDPTYEEENLASNCVSVVLDADTNEIIDVSIEVQASQIDVDHPGKFSFQDAEIFGIDDVGIFDHILNKLRSDLSFFRRWSWFKLGVAEWWQINIRNDKTC